MELTDEQTVRLMRLYGQFSDCHHEPRELCDWLDLFSRDANPESEIQFLETSQ